MEAALEYSKRQLLALRQFSPEELNVLRKGLQAASRYLQSSMSLASKHRKPEVIGKNRDLEPEGPLKSGLNQIYSPCMTW